MPKWNAWTEQRLSNVTAWMKRRRVETFVRRLALGSDDTVLDLGSEDGSYLARYYPWRDRIVLADIREEPMRRGVAKYGLKDYLVLSVDGAIPAEDAAFHAVWCNSVIEHVTCPRDQLGQIAQREFRLRGDEHQRRFAAEVRRVGRQYFVQTPYLHFPIEAHSWLPWTQYLPHPVHWRLARAVKKIWIKQWTADALLYSMQRFREHFPDATEYQVERFMGVPKSLIAIRADRGPSRSTPTGSAARSPVSKTATAS